MSEKAKIVKGQKFGDWQTIKCLGGGGNAVVWLVSNSASESAAIKLLTKIEGKSEAKVYSRFRKEIEVVCQNRDIEGLLPIIDSCLPEEVGENIPWYVMPVAQPIDTVKWNFETAVQIVLEIGKVLIRLHERGVSHRDVKPANMLIYQGRYYLSDFGLVDHPGKQDLTGTQERIGAKWTIAPEMERNSRNADGKLADVYSLAKTLWILLTGQKLGFEGQYNPSSINGLVNFRLTDLYIRPLEDLIRDSTDDDPLKRPNMFGFVERLADWIQISKDFRASNRLQWQDIQNDFFPTTVPQRVVWEDIEEIAKVLGYLCSVNLNHMHLPDKGGMDLLGVSLGDELETLELIVGDKSSYIVKPKRLLFESFGFDMEWNYFRLETGDLEPTNLAPVSFDCERLVELEPLCYLSRDAWEYDMEEERKYPTDPKFVKRNIRGDFLIIQKTSLYNRSATYTGNHGQMNADEFREDIARKIQLIQPIPVDEQFDFLQRIYRQEYLKERGTVFGGRPNV